MDVVKALQQVPRFKELNKKGKSRTAAEETEYQEMLAKTPAFKDILLYERYAELVEMSGRTNVQESELRQVEMMHPKIVDQYNRRKLGKGRSRRRRVLRKKTARRYNGGKR